MARHPLRIILAVSDDNFIADCDGEIPWNIPFDMKWFKMNTIGSTIGMGRKTWNSIGRPLPNRHHIVLSHTNLDHAWKSVEQCYSMRQFRERMRETNGWLIGGANVAQQMFTKGNILVLTRVHTEILSGLPIVLPRMKCLWTSKEIVRSGYTMHMSINKIL